MGAAFLLEIGLLFALAVWGFNVTDNVWLGYVLGLGAPVLAAAAWGIFAAPRSNLRLKQPVRLVFALSLFSLASIGLYSVGQTGWAIAFELLAVANQVLIWVWKQ